MKKLRVAIATVVYAGIDVLSFIFQMFLMALPVFLATLITFVLPLQKSIQIMILVGGLVGMFLVNDWLRKNGKPIDLWFREKTQHLVVYLGGDDFLK